MLKDQLALDKGEGSKTKKLVKQGAGHLDDVQGMIDDSLGIDDAPGIDVVDGAVGGGDETIGFQGFVDPLVMKVVPKEGQVLASYALNWALLYLIKDVFEISAGVGLNFNTTSLTLAQMNKKLDELQKDVNTLLEADYKAALDWLKFVGNELAEEQYSAAYESLLKVQELSIRGYSQIKEFSKKVFCKKMSIYAIRMIKSYRKDTLTFVDVTELTENEQRVLANNVFAQLEPLVDDFEKLSTNVLKRFFGGEKSKTEQQDILDSLLKTTLPIIWHHIDIFKTEHCTSQKMLRYIPEGDEDSSEIILEGKWPIKLYKLGNFLRFDFHQNHDREEITTKFNSISSKKM